MLSDQGPQFNSQVWRDFCATLGTVIQSSGYHPQSNGQGKRTNQNLESVLQCVTAPHPASWSSFLPWVEYARNPMASASMVDVSLHGIPWINRLFEFQEEEVAVPSIEANLCRCKRLWRRVCSVLLFHSPRARPTITLFPPSFCCMRGVYAGNMRRDVLSDRPRAG